MAFNEPAAPQAALSPTFCATVVDLLTYVAINLAVLLVEAIFFICSLLPCHLLLFMPCALMQSHHLQRTINFGL